MVIPANARKELGIEAKTKLLVFQCLQGKGLIMMKWDAIEQILSLTNERGCESGELNPRFA